MRKGGGRVSCSATLRVVAMGAITDVGGRQRSQRLDSTSDIVDPPARDAANAWESPPPDESSRDRLSSPMSNFSLAIDWRAQLCMPSDSPFTKGAPTSIAPWVITLNERYENAFRE